MLDLFREIAQTLKHNKLRTALTGFAVAWGIFLLIVLLGLARGTVNNFEEWWDADKAATMTVWGGVTTKPYRGLKPGRRIELRYDDMAAIRGGNSSHVRDVTAQKQIDTAVVSTQREYLSGGVSGVFPEIRATEQLGTLKGRFINRKDMEELRKSIVLARSDADKLFGDSVDAVGRRVKALGLSWLVVGVYDHEWNQTTYIPFSTAMALSGTDNQVSEVTVLTKDLSTVDDGTRAEQDVRATLAHSHRFDASDEGGVYLWNRFTSYLTNKQGMGILTTGVWVLGVLTLLSGIVGVSNIMFVSVRERTHEIGIRRAIGAKPRSILLQVVAESVAITTLFGYIGVVAGMALTQMLSTFLDEKMGMKNPTVDLSIALEVTVLLIIAGAAAGLFPALKATKVKPVEALRYE